MNQRIIFKIIGTHCQSCKTLIEEEVKQLPGLNKIFVDYLTGSANLEFDDAKLSKEEIFKTIKKINYQIKELNPEDQKQNSFLVGLLIPIFLIILIGGYFLIKYFGGFEILAKLNEGNVGYGLIFIIGLLAGFHCIGMCGSLVVTYSTICLNPENEQNKRSFLPHLQYNGARLLSYTIIGGILGGFGSFFGVNPVFTGTITLLAGVFMLLMGLSLISKSPILEKLKVRTPQFIVKYIYNQKNQHKAPYVIGLLNGLMPCGPLQAVQLYALASGSLIKGALSLFLFGLGTTPLMFGFGAFLSAITPKQVQKVLKFSGALVIILSLFMVNRGLTNFGFGIGFNNLAINVQNSNVIQNNGQVQEIKMDLTYFGYQPNVLYAKKGIPVRWVINAKEISGCTRDILLPDYNIRKTLSAGENIIEFTPTKTGEVKFSCGMGMVWGKFIING